MSDEHDAKVKAIRERQQRQAITDAQWLRERGIVAGQKPGSWKPMGMGEHFKQMLGGTPEGQRQSGRFIGNLPAAYAQEAIRAMPLGDIPIRDKHGRIVEWRSREEFERPRNIYDPVHAGSADPTLILANLLDPSPGGEAALAVKRGAILGGGDVARGQLAEVMNIIRKYVKGEARRALLDRLKRGLLFVDVPAATVGEGALGDITFDVPTGQQLQEIADLSNRDIDRLQTIIRRQREEAEQLYKQMGGPDVPPLTGDPTLSRLRIGMLGLHPQSTMLHEVGGHIPEFGAPAMTRARLQHFAERGAPTRPGMPPYEQPVYWLQEWAAGERPTGRYTLERLQEMGEKGYKVPKETMEQAKLREALELYGYDVAGLEGAVPKQPLWEKMQRR